MKSRKPTGYRTGKTSYKYVTEFKDAKGKIYYNGSIKIEGKYYTYCSNDCKSCALQLDKKLIESGKDPVNILIRK